MIEIDKNINKAKTLSSKFYTDNNIFEQSKSIFEDSIQIIAQMAAPVIKLAEEGNNVALSVVQEATHAVANYIISLTDELNYSKNV